MKSLSLLTRLTVRTLKVNRKRTWITLAGIIISTAMIAAVSSFYVSFLTLIREDSVAANGNWHVRLSSVPASRLGEVAEDTGFSTPVVSREAGYALLPESGNAQKPYVHLLEMEDSQFTDGSAAWPLRLTEGRWPESAGEIAVPEHLKDNGGVTLRPGDRVVWQIGSRVDESGQPLPQNRALIRSGSGDAAERVIGTTPRTLTVVGIIGRPVFEPFWAPGYTVVTRLDPTALRAEDTVTVSLLADRISRDVFQDARDLGARLGLPEDAVSLNDEVLRYHGAVADDGMNRMLWGFVSVIIGIILLAAVSLIYNAFSISVSERTRQMGLLSAVGATRAQKRRLVYREGWILAAVAIPAGLLSGLLGAGIILRLMWPVMEQFSNLNGTSLRLVVSWEALAAAAGVSVLTILLSAWIPARRASRTTPMEAIRQSRDIRVPRGGKRASRLRRKLFGMEADIAGKNIRRYRGKHRVVVFSLTVSMVLFLTVSYYMHMISLTYRVMEEDGYSTDLMIQTDGVPDDLTAVLDGVIDARTDVTDRTRVSWHDARIRVPAGSLTELAAATVPGAADGSAVLSARINVMDDASYTRYTGLDAEQSAEDAVILNYGMYRLDDGRRAAGTLFSAIPSQVTLLPWEGTTPETGMTVPVLLEQTPPGVQTMGGNTFIVQLILSETAAEALSVGLLDEPLGSALYVTAGDPDALETQIRNWATEQGISAELSLYNVAAQRQSMQALQLFVSVFLYGFLLLVSLICVANIFNTTAISVALRRKEFAMLRSVGMTPRSFLRMIRYESVLYGIKTVLLGIPVSLLVMRALFYLSEEAMVFSFTIPWRNLILAISLIFLTVSASMLYASARVRKENILDGLREDTY